MKRTKPIEVGCHLVIDPRVCHGKMTFKGTRVPVETVLYFLSQGWTRAQILADWPQLTEPAVEEAVQLASKALMDRHQPKARHHEPVHS